MAWLTITAPGEARSGGQLSPILEPSGSSDDDVPLLPLLRRTPPSRRRAKANRTPVRGRTTLALGAGIVLLAFLLLAEVRGHARTTERLAAEYVERSTAASPDRLGRFNLSAWREATADEGVGAGSSDWPAWWGSSDAVGRSPFDHVPSRGRRRRVLFLTSYTDYLERMNTHTYELVDAAMRHPDLVVDVWGPGWAGYDWDVPLSVNVKRRANRVAQLEKSDGPWEAFDDSCADDSFDFAWTISDIYKAHDMPHVDALDCGTLLVQQAGDCHSHRCMREWYPQANNITVSKYAFELEEVFNVDNVKKHYPDFHLGLFAHSPDTANEWDFFPIDWRDKESKAVVFGFDGGFYPLRSTVTEYLNKGGDADSPITRHPHPGYEVHVPQDARDHPLETYTPGHETYATHRALREDFASGMRRAQICVFDSSLERKLIRKYAQAFMSGCVVAGDLPTEHEEALTPVTIRLQPTWPIERINEEINAYLAQPERLHQMAIDAFAYARKHLSTTSKVSDMLRLVDLHRAGHRGYDYAHSFSLRCRAYWSDDSAPRPSWCTPKHYRGLEDEVAV